MLVNIVAKACDPPLRCPLARMATSESDTKSFHKHDGTKAMERIVYI